MTYSSLNLSLLLPGKPVPVKLVGLPVSIRVGHFKAQPDPEARSLEVALPVQGSWRVGLGSGSGFGSGLTSLTILLESCNYLKATQLEPEILLVFHRITMVT